MTAPMPAYISNTQNYHDLLVEMSKGTVTPSEKWDFLLTTLGK